MQSISAIPASRSLAAAAACAVLLLAGCATRTAEPGPASAQLRRLGHHTFKVTTRSAAAQRACDRGLTLAYSFGHHAAEQEFRRAVEADPDCAMGWWGIALVNGPHINFPAVPPDKAAAAWEALTKARALAAKTSPLEKALINALAARYANPQPADRAPLDQAYAAAMRQVWQANPKNADVATLFAEALMDLHPWDLWNKSSPQPWTPEILETLNRALALDPYHPGANHLFIHAVEASPHPEQGIAAAERLARLVPDASHMVHMPAHIYARVGRWADAAQANRDAMQADALYRTAYPRPGFYAMYMAHNAHFLAYVAMMQGRSAEALRCAHTMVADVPEEFLKDYAPVADGYMIFVSEVLMRFGRWDEVLAAADPGPQLPLSRALWRFTRASALTSLDRAEEARAEKTAFETAAAAVPGNWRFGNNSAADILTVARQVLEGEMLARANQFEPALSALNEAARLEDNLHYDEPPDWIQPVRHTLGAVLLRAGQAAEAERVYRDDLQRYPGNGWSLMGLRDALRAQGKLAEAQQADAQWKQAWASADVRPTATCYCQAEKAK